MADLGVVETFVTDDAVADPRTEAEAIATLAALDESGVRVLRV